MYPFDILLKYILRLGVERILLSIWKIMVISCIFDNLLVGCLFNDKLGSKYYIIV